MIRDGFVQGDLGDESDAEDGECLFEGDSHAATSDILSNLSRNQDQTFRESCVRFEDAVKAAVNVTRK